MSADIWSFRLKWSRVSIAGGYEACYQAVEASEDDAGARSSSIWISEASTKATHWLESLLPAVRPYTVGAISYARQLGAFTVGLTWCCLVHQSRRRRRVSVVPVVGPEVVTGSSRLKAGTAQKMVLNVISTATMVRLGLRERQPHVSRSAATRTSSFVERALRILMKETGLQTEAADSVLQASGINLSCRVGDGERREHKGRS